MILYFTDKASKIKSLNAYENWLRRLLGINFKTSLNGSWSQLVIAFQSYLCLYHFLEFQFRITSMWSKFCHQQNDSTTFIPVRMVRILGIFIICILILYIHMKCRVCVWLWQRSNKGTFMFRLWNFMNRKTLCLFLDNRNKFKMAFKINYELRIRFRGCFNVRLLRKTSENS